MIKVQETFTIILICIAFLGCHNQTKNNSESYLVNIKTLSEDEYPDNPDKSIESSLADVYSHDKVIISHDSGLIYSFTFLPGNAKSDTLFVKGVNLTEWIPKTDLQNPFLAEIALQNFEYNRQQVKFTSNYYQSKGSGNENEIIGRLDIARNCLDAGLWEIITYDTAGAPYYHGWFDFPLDLYEGLFNQLNTQVKYTEAKKYLEHWEDKKGQIVNLRDVRGEVLDEFNLPLINKNNSMYPLVGERKKKFPNIIYPKNPQSINDFLTDSTVFATFTQPGYYSKANPRKTRLSKLARPIQAVMRNLANHNIELEITYTNKNNMDTTKLIIGGFTLSGIPALLADNCNNGYQMPMGIGNHSFYEYYEEYLQSAKQRHNYYGLLLDKDNIWLDSHTVGIDGPLLHFDKQDPTKLHLWILSFERHAMVGHYILTIPDVLLN